MFAVSADDVVSGLKTSPIGRNRHLAIVDDQNGAHNFLAAHARKEICVEYYVLGLYIGNRAVGL